MASSWVPEAEFVTDPRERDRPGIRFCAALDCPGAWGLIDRYGIDRPFRVGPDDTIEWSKPRVRGRAVRRPGLGARSAKAGSCFCGTAVYDAEGTVCAAAAATWIQLK